MKKILISILLIGFCYGVQAQGLFSPRKLAEQYTTVGIGGGSSHYFGDLAPYSYAYHSLYTNVRWNGTVNYTRHFNSQFAVRADFTWARIAGDDYTFSQRDQGSGYENLWRNYVRNLHFRNDIKEFTISGIYNLLPQYSKGARGRKDIMPYVRAGLGFYAHDPKVTLPVTLVGGESGVWQSAKQYNTAGQTLPTSDATAYSLVQVVVPVGFGIRYKLNEKWNISLEGSLRLTPFDYLDDVGDDAYFDPSQLQSNFGQFSAALGQRSTEGIHSRTGENRIPLLIQFSSDANKINGIGSSSFDPSFLNQVEGFEAVNGNRQRGTSRIDSYFLTQFTISYIISNKIKCPVIK